MARKTTIVWAMEDNAQYQAEPVAEVRTRLHALWLLHLGEGPTVVGVSRNTVQTWLQWYRSGGLAEVRAHRRGGPGKPSYLPPDQQAQLAADTGLFTTSQTVRDWLEAEFGVVSTVGSLYTLLPRLGIRLKRPRPRHTKAAPQVQMTWNNGGSGHG